MQAQCRGHLPHGGCCLSQANAQLRWAILNRSFHAAAATRTERPGSGRSAPPPHPGRPAGQCRGAGRCGAAPALPGQRPPFPDSRHTGALFQARVTSSALPSSLPTAARSRSGSSPCRHTGRRARLSSRLFPLRSSRAARAAGGTVRRSARPRERPPEKPAPGPRRRPGPTSPAGGRGCGRTWRGRTSRSRSRGRGPARRGPAAARRRPPAAPSPVCPGSGRAACAAGRAATEASPRRRGDSGRGRPRWKSPAGWGRARDRRCGPQYRRGAALCPCTTASVCPYTRVCAYMIYRVEAALRTRAGGGQEGFYTAECLFTECLKQGSSLEALRRAELSQGKGEGGSVLTFSFKMQDATGI